MTEKPPPADPAEWPEPQLDDRPEPSRFALWWRGHMGWLGSRRTSTVLAVAVTVLAVLLVLQGIQANAARDQANADRDRFADCLADYSDELGKAIEARARAGAEATDAQDELWTVISENFTEGGGENIRDAIIHYREVRAEARKAQRENPYPPPPKISCR